MDYLLKMYKENKSILLHDNLYQCCRTPWISACLHGIRNEDNKLRSFSPCQRDLESYSNHWGRLTHMCVSTLYCHCFRLWLSLATARYINLWFLLSILLSNWNSIWNPNAFIPRKYIWKCHLEFFPRPQWVKLFDVRLLHFWTLV